MKHKTSNFLLSVFFLFSFLIISPEKAVQAQNPCDFPVFPGGREVSSNNVFVPPTAVALGDFNNDGKLDIVTTSYDARAAPVGKITVFLGTGTGNFSSIKDFNADPYAFYISLGDVNGDGNLDAIVFTHIQNEVRILLGDGTGNFSLLNKFSYYSPRKIEVLDITRDGKTDLLVSGGDSYSAMVSVYPGIGDGTFAAPIETSFSGGNPGSLAVDDFNRDGKFDFATISSSKVSVWLGNGTGQFQMNWTSNQAGGEIVKGNLNNDNYTDLAVGVGGQVVVFFGNGDGTFQLSERYSTDGQGGGAETKIADLNRDGWNDIVTQNFGTDNVSILLGTGSGRFAQAKNQPVGFRPKHFALGDFNSDGSPDAVTISATAIPTSFLDTLRLTLGKGDGTFIAPITLGINPSAEAFAVADVNSDGKDDIVSANSSSLGISVLLRTGNFKFAPARTFAQSNNFYFVSAADFNNDGKLDIAGVGGSSGIVLLGDGSGGFTPAQTLTLDAGSWATYLGSADFNRDGKLDLVVSNESRYGFLIFRGNGDGSFESPAFYSIGDPPKRIAIGDFNRDGLPDLVIAVDTFLSLQGRVQVRLNQGAGIFQAAANDYYLGVAIHPRSVITNDFDGDGKLDFAVTTDGDPTAPGRVSIYKGRGDGNFNRLNAYSVGDTTPSDLIAKDFNNDGKLDIVTVNYLSSNDISVFAGAGDATFSLVQTIPIGISPRMISAGNFNNDSSPDLLINSVGFTIARNTCNQAAETIESKTEYDFDGDGRADISVYRPSNGAWYLQQSTNGFTGIQFGASTDRMVPSDYDGDGKTDPAVFRNGVWYLYRSSLGFTGISFGESADIPVPSDYDGDGRADLAVFRPATGVWYLQRSSLGFTGIAFGQAGDRPIPADYDGDGQSDIAVYRDGTWYLQRSQAGFTGISFGETTDKPVPSDYDGDGKSDVAVFRPSNGTWYLQRSQAGFTGVQFGLGTDSPVPADYDGDGKTDVAVFRDGNWYLNRSSQGFTGVSFGALTDKPVPNAFVY